MTWSFPLAFSLAAFLLVLLLRQIKAPPVPERVIGSIALWQQLAARRGRLAAGAQWWSRPGLLLWIAGIVFLILSAAGPVRWHTAGHPPGDLVLVIDNRGDVRSTDSSFWMQTTATAAKLVETANAKRKIAVVTTAPAPHVVHPFSPNPENLIAAIHGLVPSPSAPGSPTEALELAFALQSQNGESIVDPGILWISGSLPPAMTDPSGKSRVQFLPPTVASGGLSIADIALSRQPGRPGFVYWQAGIHNASSDSMDLRLESGFGRLPSTGTPMNIPPGETAWRSGELPLPSENATPFRLQAVALGKSATTAVSTTLAVPPAPRYSVEIVGNSETRFWESAFAAMPGWTVRIVPADEWQPAAPGPDLWVLIGIKDAEKIRQALELAPSWLVESAPFSGPATNLQPEVVFEDLEHPALQGVNIGDTSIRAAVSLAKTEIPNESEMQILAASPGGPLVLAGNPGSRADGNPGFRWLGMAFRPEASNLALRAAFPVLVRQGTLWLLDRETFASEVFVRFGTPGTSAFPGGPEEQPQVFSTAAWWVPTFAFLGLFCLALAARQIKNSGEIAGSREETPRNVPDSV